jgi:hypothetical protein
MITSLLEEKGGTIRMKGESKAFREWTKKFRLIDMQIGNGPFT